MWNDDFHHSAVGSVMVATKLISPITSGPAGIYSAAKYGSLSGPALSWRKALRGTPTLGIPPEVFVCCLENHDQIANTGTGERLRLQTSAGRYRALTALFLLGPWTPLLFQDKNSARPIHSVLRVRRRCFRA